MSKYMPYVVRQGDHVKKIAFRGGADPSEVWDHPSNAELKARRSSMDMLLPGDVLFLPPKPKGGLDLTIGSKNKYRANVPSIGLKVVLRSDSRSLGGEPYEVHGTGTAEPLRGTTGPNGEVDAALPVWVREIEIHLPEAGVIAPIRVGDLDPPDEPSGLTQRLRNLGYLPATGEVSGEQRAAALQSYQHDQGREPTGDPDAATLESLTKSNHG